MSSMRRMGTICLLTAALMALLLTAMGTAAQETPSIFQTNTAAETPGLDETAPAPDAPIDGETPRPDDPALNEAMQWTAYLQQMTAFLNGAVSWLAGLSVGYFVVVVLALLGVVLLVLHFARRYVPLPVFQTVETLAKETVTAVKDLSEKRLEDAKKTASPIDDAVFQITSTLANLVLALAGGAPAIVSPAAAGVTTEMARLQAQVAELQRYTFEPAKSSDAMAAERARMKYGTPSGMPQMPYTHTPGGAPLYGPGTVEDDGGIG